MKQPRDQHWAELLGSLEEEAEEAKGYGYVIVRIDFHDRRPQGIEVRERVPKYLLGKKGAAEVVKSA